MTKNKIAVVAMAAMLAMALSLTACGGGSGSGTDSATESPSTAAASSEAATSQASSDAGLSALYLAGTLADGSTVDYLEEPTTRTCTLIILNADQTDGKSWSGIAQYNQDSDSFTISDQLNGDITYSLTMPNGTAEKYAFDIEGYGEVELLPVDSKQFQEHLMVVADIESKA